jgi:hypothetical protein
VYQPQTPPKKSRTLPIALGGAGVVLLLCLGGTAIAAISGDDKGYAEGYADGVAAAAASATPTTRATTVAPVRTTEPAGTVEPAAVTSKPAKKAATTAVKVKVPDGVGLDYQSAQDLWRAAGLVVAPAVDATGAHRLPLVDANWVVLGQDLEAGSRVGDGTVITATVKKFSDG